MPEKRRHRRASLLYYLKICDLASGQDIGHLADISLGGFKMVSKSRVEPGADYHVRIYLPEDLGLQEFFTVKAKSCWCRTDVNPDYYASGFCFISLSLECIRLIKILINQYELTNSTTRAV